MKKNHEIIELEIHIKNSTERAVMVENMKGENVWLPLSMVEIDIPQGLVELPEWLAIEKGLI